MPISSVEAPDRVYLYGRGTQTPRVYSHEKKQSPLIDDKLNSLQRKHALPVSENLGDWQPKDQTRSALLNPFISNENTLVRYLQKHSSSIGGSTDSTHLEAAYFMRPALGKQGKAKENS
ncbi:uncharacterized protein PHALS_04206 [Plasmopara halstedii]|uniref:Uncharacterized protein n=1 Tax=Plasmopara halstedii TaxID=4781 RepID=A0A0P1AA15_PLAHL|nr:uncharacterized protein PHALS_04206 [Plasmopara halstedii]CEG36957.1 hypothetical protein PHALS_04206 [Plasmopara halstedii]|eukprot:XP_024573326.1 hypothetical protein PHALS_04206 [Plasmopara halstedii]